MTLQLIECIEQIHKRGYIHGDIKPQNICLKQNGKALNLSLIDFGLAKNYLEDDGTHIAKRKDKKFSGNLPFASVSMCRQFTPTRRDDFEAIFYILLWLLNDHKLPWDQFLDTPLFKFNVGRAIDCYMTKRLEFQMIKGTIDLLPKKVGHLLKQVLLLDFVTRPDYESFRILMLNSEEK